VNRNSIQWPTDWKLTLVPSSVAQAAKLLCSGSVWLNSVRGSHQPDNYFVVFFSHTTQILIYYFKIFHDCFQFFIRDHPVIPHYRIWVTEDFVMSITVAARSKARTVFVHSNAGIVGSNPTQGMDVCVSLFCVCVVLCVGSGLATGWFPVQGVLLYV
jgi:hypothetical protein